MKKEVARRELRVCFYIGGFSAIGGIESFMRDLLLGLAAWSCRKLLIVWGEDVPVLKRIEAAGISVYRSSLRHGCRLAIPDIWLAVKSVPKLRWSDLVVLRKLPKQWILRAVFFISSWRRSKAPNFLYITPYRPIEMWPNGMPVVCHRIHCMIVQAPVFADDLRCLGYKGRVCVIPLIPPKPVQIGALGLRRSGSVPKLGFLGRLVAQKNLSYFMDVLEIRDHPPIEMHVYGDGEERSTLERRARVLDVPVFFHGALARDDVPGAIDYCDAFVIPSLSEGQCLVALEVLSRGRPLLGTPVGALPYILSSSVFGRLMPLGDVRVASDVTGRFLEDLVSGYWCPDVIVQEYARRYSRVEVLKAYQRIFEEMIV